MRKGAKNLCTLEQEESMSYKRREPLGETNLFEELMPYGGKLNLENRWIKLSKQIPWEKLERVYKGYFSNIGRPGTDCRLMISLLIVKHIGNLSDEGVVEYFYENPYVQYLCGYESLVVKKIIDVSTLTKIRKRLGVKFLKKFEEEVINLLLEKKLIKLGELIVDATVCPANIKYPTDTGLLEEGREKIVKMIKNILKKIGIKKKIRTYCRTARKVYMKFQKKGKKRKKEIRGIKKQMLQFLRRNLKQIEWLIEEMKKRGEKLEKKMEEKYEVVKKMFKQQEEMYKKKTKQIKNRIVSLHKPEIRPIVRGKAGKEVEFGPKISVSVVEGYGFLDKYSTDAYHEGKELRTSIKKYGERFKKKPKAVIGDKAYGTRENRKLVKQEGIRMSVKKLGKKSEKSKIQERWVKKKQKERNRVEGLIGTLKTKYGLDRLKYKIVDGEELNIRLGMLAMNLDKMLVRI